MIVILDVYKRQVYVCAEAQINDVDKKKVSFKENLKDPIYKVLLTGDPEYVASIEEEFKKPFQDELSIYRSAPFFIEAVSYTHLFTMVYEL